ncbi:hypothetical protein SAMN02745911_1207 [Aureimonas altamirensis DSM 21988]|uniref:Uncharacterized protein n=2 Tax=Aureimonas altamirensis TaxID=370622 RepID=A0A0P0YXJ2_9HYPH|nr:hypothetical protein [Aureimonas altamirensis]BAT26062.1 hypothetical protein [Aureimonas altamirensis]SHI80027.1 hypothetical protein SAMN02745911_1207 [Aureimonas altamirensis DSM 21988]
MAQVTNNSQAVRVINAKNGDRVVQVSIAPGQTKDIDVVETKVFKSAVEAGVLSVKGGAKASSSPPAGGYAVTEKGSGWFAITQDGKEVTKGLRKDAVDGFAKMNDEQKAAFVQANKAEA